MATEIILRKANKIKEFLLLTGPGGGRHGGREHLQSRERERESEDPQEVPLLVVKGELTSQGHEGVHQCI